MKRQITLTLISLMALLMAIQTFAKVWRVSSRIINGETVDADYNS